MSTLLNTLKAYHGDIRPSVHSQVECVQFSPQSSGHMRVHTRESFNAPVRASWWVYTQADMRPGGTSGGQNLDGLHVLFGHQGNDLNYNAHLVRRDGRSKVALEQGLAGYRDLTFSDGLPLRMWRRYLFTLEWHEDRVRIQVSNDNHVGSDQGRHGNVEYATIECELPQYGPKFGQLSWRFDNLVTRFGGLSVTNL